MKPEIQAGVTGGLERTLTKCMSFFCRSHESSHLRMLCGFWVFFFLLPEYHLSQGGGQGQILLTQKTTWEWQQLMDPSLAHSWSSQCHTCSQASTPWIQMPQSQAVNACWTETKSPSRRLVLGNKNIYRSMQQCSASVGKIHWSPSVNWQETRKGK